MSHTAPDPSPHQRPATPDTRSDLALSPFCVHLQSKKLFFAPGPPMEIDDILDASRHCWCRNTMQALGPDGDVVDPRDCQAGRSCFESIL
jgi:hypothetical protein